MKFGIGKFEFIVTAIIVGIVMSILYCQIQKEICMPVDRYAGQDGFTVDVDCPEDVYNTIDGMHTQAMETLGEDSDTTMFLSKMMELMKDEVELDEDELYAP